MQLEVDKILEITGNNKKLILKAVELINDMSNESNIKVAYIKILSNLLKFHKGIENYLYYNNSESTYLEQKKLDKEDNSLQVFDEIKASLKTEFNRDNFSSEKAEEFYNFIEVIESNIYEIFNGEEVYEFNNYLIYLINDSRIDEFIWLNTIYNIYKDNHSLKDIVTDYRTFSQIEFSDLYKMYLFVTDYNINNLLLQGESEFIKEEYLDNVNLFFNYMYMLVEDTKTFIPKESKKNILSFESKLESYTSMTTPTKEEFLEIVKKIYLVLKDISDNDNSKLFLDNVYPLVIKSFLAPLRNEDKIKYDFNLDFLYAIEYLETIIEVMSDKNE
ncbi:MAG: hypothetical protein Q3988_05160 [Gemella sp.]|nr:hypothetical protein [Gemella sp.]